MEMVIITSVPGHVAIVAILHFELFQSHLFFCPFSFFAHSSLSLSLSHTHTHTHTPCTYKYTHSAVWASELPAALRHTLPILLADYDRHSDALIEGLWLISHLVHR